MGGATFHEFVHAIWLNGREMDLAPLVALCGIVHAYRRAWRSDKTLVGRQG
jgi:hypothetical protein